MKITQTEIHGCYRIIPDIHEDERGWFGRMYCEQEFGIIRKGILFKQINQSYNKKAGTFRGMHYQLPPFGEEKLVRCLSGGIMDFVLDLRRHSPTFMKHLSLKLTAGNREMIFIPNGLAHGFQTLYDDTNILYHHTTEFAPEYARGVRFNDPMVNIELPLPISVISEKDENFELLNSNYEGIDI